MAARVLAVLALGLALAGCLPSEVEVSNEYLPQHAGATQPVAHLAAFMWSDSSEKTSGRISQLRFIRSDNGYVMEVYLSLSDQDKNRHLMLPLIAHFIPLGDDWYALHTGLGLDSQSYMLVRLKDGTLAISDLVPLGKRMEELAALANISLKTEPSLAFEGAPPEEKVIAILKALTAFTPTVSSSLSTVPAIPPQVIAGSTEILARLASTIKASDLQSSELLAHLSTYFLQLHEEGNGWGSFALSRFLGNDWIGIAPSNAQNAAGLARTAIKRGVPQANTTLGYQAYLGMGMPANPEQAIPYLRLAAEAQDPRAFTFLGYAYRDGKGVEQDSVKAKAWLERAVEAGFGHAYTVLAAMLLADRTPDSDARAAFLLEKSMAEDEAYAYYLRGWMHAYGRAGPVDDNEATAFFMTAAQLGESYSQWLVGERLIAGQGVAQNRMVGEHWIRRAHLAGVSQATAAMQRYSLQPLAPFPPTPRKAGNSYAHEQQNWKIAATSSFTNPEYSLTPTDVPGARTINTEELQSLLAANAKLLVVDVIDHQQLKSLPGAYRVPGLSQALGDTANQQRAEKALAQLSEGDKYRPIVFLCTGVHCWLSYNAAAFALHAGYRDVIWYRGGLTSWQSAGFDMRPPKIVSW